MRDRAFLCRLLVAIVLAFASAGHAAPPKVSYLFPAGVGRGQSATIEASGEFSNWPVQIWCENPRVSITVEKDKGKLTVSTPEDMLPGVVWLRIFDAEGASSLRPLLVSSLPELLEIEPNDMPGKGQVVNGDAVVNGRLQKAGDVDGFAVELKKDETLTAALQAHSLLGSPMDAVVQICQLIPRGDSSAEPSRVEAFVLEQNHDVIGLDPVVMVTAPRDGTYLVRVFAFPSEPNSNIGYAGGDNFVYRLTLTRGGFDSAAILPPLSERAPLVVAQGAGSEQPLNMPCLIAGKLAQPAETHSFSFTADKGKKIAFQSLSHAAGLPTEPTLRVVDEKGATLAEAEGGDPKKDLELVITPPAAGNYRLLVRDLFDRGGPFLNYRLHAAVQAPYFTLATASDSFALSADKPLEIPLTVDRRFGFAETIEIAAKGLPAGVKCEVVKSEPKGDSAKAVKLIIQGSAECQAGGYPFVIEAKDSSGQATSKTAQFSTSLPLDQKHDSLWLTVKK